MAQELVTGLLSGQDYIKRNPDTEAMAKAQSIMNAWGIINLMQVLVTLLCCLGEACRG